MLCDAHNAATVHGMVLDSFVGADIQGVIRNSLSLKVVVAINTLRKAMREVIESKGIRILEGTPPLCTTRLQRYYLRLFCAHGKNRLGTRILLMLLPNGDWRASTLQL